MATATNSTVFCRPRAVPTRAGPAISAAAANETPLPAIVSTPAAIRARAVAPSGAGTSRAASRVVAAPASARVRSGAMRSRSRSDQMPATTRAAAPPNWIRARAPAAAPTDQPRSSCR